MGHPIRYLAGPTDEIHEGSERETMTVYVDNMRIRAKVGTYVSRWSHLTADTREELHTFAELIGLNRSWFQEGTGLPGTYGAESWHYDVTDSKRKLALDYGAKPVEWDELPTIIMNRTNY